MFMSIGSWNLFEAFGEGHPLHQLAKRAMRMQPIEAAVRRHGEQMDIAGGDRRLKMMQGSLDIAQSAVDAREIEIRRNGSLQHPLHDLLGLRRLARSSECVAQE